ncbi:MFS transporter [Nocardiopsis sp. YSL2]|uniref:MFS transporter n=1 Tax=Nocardiopsis sp. YSL2 TaxID=2939492 RepID=UPI0026F450E1|nr:MFS transporter [Nocardiopsis sp. YSL2]
MDPTPVPANAHRAPTTRLGTDFHRFWAAGTLTNLGDGILSTALPLIAATLTHDPLAVSGLAVVRFLPWLLFAPFAGVLIDRVDRMRAMAVANALAAVVVAALTITVATSTATLGVMYAALFAVTCCETVTDPASRIAVTRLVPGRLLDRANSRLEGGRLVAQDCVARPLGGALFAVAAVLPVAGTALSYALCAVLTILIVVSRRRSGRVGTGRTEPVRGAAVSASRQLREGFGHVFGNPLMRALALNNAAMMIGLQMGTAVLVLHVRHEWGVGAAYFGLFTSSLAVGGVLGAVCAAPLIARLGRRAVLLGGYTVGGLGLALMALLPDAYLGAVVLAVVGLCLALTNIAGSLLFQTMVPDHLRGRASAAFRALGWGLAPVGALAGGLLGRVDLSLPYLVGGLTMVVAVVVFRRVLTEFARRSDESAANLAADAVPR